MKSKKYFVSFFLLFFFSCSDKLDNKNVNNIKNKKKIFYVNSYHKGYAWSDGIRNGILSGFGIFEKKDGVFDYSHSLVIFKEYYMDTKRHKEKAFKLRAGLEAKKLIDEWKPDIVIASDDNAVKYVVEKYLNGINLPVVFLGVNGSLKEYNLKTNINITGSIELALYPQIYGILKKYVNKKKIKISFISVKTISAQKVLNNLKKLTIFNNIEYKFVDDFNSWKKQILVLDKHSDIIFIDNNITIKNWNDKEAESFIFNNIKSLTASDNAWMAKYVLITLSSDSENYGRWAAKTALRILNGEKPNRIPIKKRQEIHTILNMKLAKKIKIIFPIDLLENAELIN